MSEPVIEAMHPTWIKIICSFLIVYTDCRRLRTGRGHNSRIKMIVNNLEGLDLDVDGHDLDDGDATDIEYRNEKKSVHHVRTMIHLQDASKTMTSLFPDEVCPSDEGKEAFNSCLKQNLTQTKTHGFAPSQRPSIMFSLLSGPTRTDFNGLKIQLLLLDEMLLKVPKRRFYLTAKSNTAVSQNGLP